MLTQEQKQRRLKGIGGSDAAAVMGFSTFRTAFDVWLEKTGRVVNETSKETHPWLYWGSILEAVIADEYALVTNQQLEFSDTLIHPDHPWMLGHPDRLIVGKNKLLECKIAREMTARKEWGNTTDGVKLDYIIQVQDYMGLTGYDEADIAVLIGNSDFRIYTIPRDEGLIKLIIEECEKFYIEHILTDIPPQPKNGKEALWIWKEDNGIYRDAVDEEVRLCLNYDLQRTAESKAKKEKERIGDELRIIVKEFSGLKSGKKEIMTYHKNKKGSRTLLVKKMENIIC